jgi:hypothetical protein
MKTLQPKKQLLFTSTTYLHISDYQPRSSVTETHFMSKFMQAACKVMGIKHTPSTAYHPRTDGQSEQSNQWLETAICFITDKKQTNWAPYLPIAQFTHNNWPSDTTQKSPFFLLMGFNLHADCVHTTSPIPRVTLHLNQFKEARNQACQAMIKAQQSCSLKKKVANSQKKQPKVGKSQRNVNFSLTFPDFWSLFSTICCFFDFLFY